MILSSALHSALSGLRCEVHLHEWADPVSLQEGRVLARDTNVPRRRGRMTGNTSVALEHPSACKSAGHKVRSRVGAAGCEVIGCSDSGQIVPAAPSTTEHETIVAMPARLPVRPIRDLFVFCPLTLRDELVFPPLSVIKDVVALAAEVFRHDPWHSRFPPVVWLVTVGLEGADPWTC